VWEFFSERIEFEKWEDGAKVPVQLDVEPEARTEVPRVIGRG
jgi:hypothetical protein